MNLRKVELETYYSSRASLKFNSLEATGGSDISVDYIYNGIPYTRDFDGSSLVEKKK